MPCVPRGGQGIDQAIGNLDAGAPDGFHKAVVKLRRDQAGEALGVGQLMGLLGMDEALLELMKAAGVVVVGMAGDGDHRFLEQRGGGLAQAGNTEPGIHHHVPIATT
jgi:hypothetical protein